MKTEELIEDFIKVWLCVYPSYERKDAITDLQTIIESVINDIKEVSKETINTNERERRINAKITVFKGIP